MARYDHQAIEAALTQLETASIELGKAVYEAASSSAGDAAGGSEGGAKPGDDLIDAEYEVKDENA